MKKLFAITLAFLFLNGCAQTTSMMGPTYTLVKTGMKEKKDFEQLLRCTGSLFSNGGFEYKRD